MFGGGGAPVPVPIQLGVTHWWDASEGITTVSGRVSSWVDRIANADAVQGLASRRPTYISNSANLNGSSLQFTAANPDGLYCSPANGSLADGTGPFTMAVSFYTDYTASHIPMCLYDPGAASWVVLFSLAAGGMRLSERNDAVVSATASTPGPTGAGSYWIIAKDDGVSTMYIYDSTGPSANAVRPARPLTANGVYIGFRNTATPLNGEVNHAMYWDRDLSGSEIVQLAAWMYGLL